MKKFSKEEKNLIVIISMIFLGLICDTSKFYLIRIDDIKTLSLTIMQIQTTIGVLVITIVSLISGSATESYYGVSVCNYYLNIKPKILTFKRIIFATLILSLFSIITYAFELYTTILCIFIATLCNVMIAVDYVYSSFSGR